MHKAAVFGAAGPIGLSIAGALQRRGVRFRAVGRSIDKLRAAFTAFPAAELHAADLADAASARTAATSADTIFYCVGVPYHDFAQHPRLMRTAIEAAHHAGVERVVVISSVYSYGVPTGPLVDELHPREPATFKGRMRKAQEDLVLGAHAKGRVKTLVLRLPDFYGPHADNSLANPIFRAALTGRPANWIGSLDAAHEFMFVPDVGPVAVELARRDECFGDAWNLAGPGAISGRTFIEMVYAAAGVPPQHRVAGKTLMRLMGLFNRTVRELVEMHYLAETPVLLDDTRAGHRAQNAV